MKTDESGTGEKRFFFYFHGNYVKIKEKSGGSDIGATKEKLLRHSDKLVVLGPAQVRNELQRRLETTLKKYTWSKQNAN